MKLTWAMNLPEAWRLLRICWQPKRLAAVAILPLLVSFLIVAYMASANYQKNKEGEQRFVEYKLQCLEHNKNKGAKILSDCNLYYKYQPEPFPYALLCQIMLGLQGLLWVFAAPAAVGMAIHSEFDKDTWVLQQTTPQPSRKLLLGKILGAPGDIYVISVLNLPFVLVSAIQARIPLIGVSKIFLISLILFALISSLMSYILLMSGKIKSAPGTLIGLFLLINYALAAGVFSVYNSQYDDASYMNIHPIALYINASSPPVTDYSGAVHQTAPYRDYVLFFNEKFSAFPFAVVFYLVIAAWFFTAADAELRRKTSMPSKRYYLFALFALAEFFFIGFTLKHPSPRDNLYSNSGIAVSFSLLVILLSYFVIFSQVRTTGEMRPWIYRTAGRGRKLQDYFSDDSPPLYSIAAILLIAFCGIAAAPAYMQVASVTYPSAHLIQAGCLSIIIFRDVLFFQIAKMCHKRGLILGLLIYALIFIAVPGLALVPNGKPLFDLSPFSAIGAIPILNDSGNDFGDYYLPLYMLTNAALAVLFYIAHSLLISAARRKFNPAPAPGRSM